MPDKPKRPCTTEGCPNIALSSASKCKEHYKEQTKQRFASIKTNPDGVKLYNSRMWRRMRHNFLYQHPFCIDCGKPASDVDHIQKHNGDRGLFFDWDNLQAMCKKCHAAKTLRGG